MKLYDCKPRLTGQDTKFGPHVRSEVIRSEGHWRDQPQIVIDPGVCTPFICTCFINIDNWGSKIWSAFIVWNAHPIT